MIAYRFARLSVAAALAVTLLGSCAAQTDRTRPESVSRGGDLVYLDAEALASMQMQVGYWQNSLVRDQVVDRLVYQDPKTYRFVPWLAEKWTTSPDGREYVFTIRPGVTFSNGQPLDAQSVKRNLEWQANGDKANGIIANPIFPKVTSIVADNATRTVRVSLPEPYAPFIPLLSVNTTGLVADATIAASKEEQSVPTNMIGTGPFYVESEVPDKKVVLRKRRGYDWAPATSPHRGEAYLNTVTVIPVTEDSVRVGALRAHQADVIRYTQPPDEKLLSQEGFDVRGLRKAGLTNTLDIRQTAPFVQDINVRRAIGFGIDRDELISTLYTDNWKPATSILTPQFPGFKDRSDAVRFDPRESARLLDASGWTRRDGAGYRVKDGKRLSLLIYVDVYDHTARPLYELIQRQLRRVGIDLVVRQTDFANYPTASIADDVALRRNGWPTPDAVRLWQNYGSSKGDLYALSGADPEIDRLLRAQLVEVDPVKRNDLVEQYADYVIDNAYTVPLLQDTQIFGVAPAVRGLDNAVNGVPWFYGAWMGSAQPVD
ncbi:ABC transporter substrate-binding protein [Gordonia sp. CPCC 206044]|uniref:ABC transporter substrate-binding protein n=1 Tax=Gordonia sp. CPCC 206044 TaxID=3140793 RepID=UPI003AF359F7